MSLIALTNVVKTYSMGATQSTVLNHISLSIACGELVAIVGASGSGKSTLMSLIGLLDKATHGRYELQGLCVAGLNDDALASLRNQTMGFIFQQFHLLPRFNVLQNVALPLTYRDMSARQAKQQALDALKQVKMASYAMHYPTQLSGGQQQRVAIARALVGDPQVILADEPTGALDSKTGQEIMALFLRLHEEGRTLIIVTHDEHIANQCRRNIALADGQILSDTSQ